MSVRLTDEQIRILQSYFPNLGTVPPSPSFGLAAQFALVDDELIALVAQDVVLAAAIAAQDVIIGTDGNPGVDGIGSKRIARATFDPSADALLRPTAVYGLGVSLPDNAIVTRAWYEVVTTFQSTAGGTDKAVLSISIPTDDVDGLVAAVAIETGTPWDAGYHDCIQTGAASAFSEKTTAARELSIEVSVQALTAGKLILFVEYVIGG